MRTARTVFLTFALVGFLAGSCMSFSQTLQRANKNRQVEPGVERMGTILALVPFGACGVCLLIAGGLQVVIHLSRDSDDEEDDDWGDEWDEDDDFRPRRPPRR